MTATGTAQLQVAVAYLLLRSNTRLEHIAAQASLVHKKRLFSFLI